MLLEEICIIWNLTRDIPLTLIVVSVNFNVFNIHLRPHYVCFLTTD